MSHSSRAMASAYQEAVAALYQAPHESFVDERKRLSAALKSSGDQDGAARFAKLGRPALSAWAVNQLWWHARADFDELFETAAELRAGKLTASAAHRKVVAKLTAAAQKLLKASGHGVADATLRRVTMTLSGLAASGGFEPDTPGALAKDRDPPGFEAFGIESIASAAPASNAAKDEERTERATKATAAPKHEAKQHAKHEAERAKQRAFAQAEQARRAAEAERARLAEERALRLAKRRSLEASVREAKVTLAEREHERTRAAKELKSAEQLLERAAVVLEAAEAGLAALDEEV